MIRDVPTIEEGATTAVTARRLINLEINHLPVLSSSGQLVGIVTSWDIAKAVARNFLWLDEIMSKNVITTMPDELIESAAKKMEKHSISALPVIDEDQHLTGLITSDAISMLIGRGTS
jgi:homoserine O-acetyltransferase